MNLWTKGRPRRANPTSLGSQILCLLTVGDTPVNSHYIQENNGPTPQVVVSKLRPQLSLQQIRLSFRGAPDGQREQLQLPQDGSCLSNRLQRASFINQCSLLSMNMKQKLSSLCPIPMSSSIDCVPDLHALWSFQYFSFCKQPVEPLTPRPKIFRLVHPSIPILISQGPASSLSEP